METSLHLTLVSLHPAGVEKLLKCVLKNLMFLEDSPKSWILFCLVLPDN